MDPDYDLHRAWGNSEELLARTLEALSLTNTMLHAAHFKEPHPEPVHIPRPGQPEPKRRMATPDEMRKMFGGAVHYVPPKG